MFDLVMVYTDGKVLVMEKVDWFARYSKDAMH